MVGWMDGWKCTVPFWEFFVTSFKFPFPELPYGYILLCIIIKYIEIIIHLAEEDTSFAYASEGISYLLYEMRGSSRK